MTRKPILLGELLIQMGRVTSSDVDRALAYQCEHGGYMGDALVSLGILSRDELWWGLANQHDIPLVHLRAEHIDHDLAARVPAEWAREHCILPVLRDEGRVTAVMREVPRPEMLEEVRVLTGASEVVPALSSPEEIAQLIEAVYGTAWSVGVADLFEEALRRGADAVGVSGRPSRTIGWYRAGGVVTRALRPQWREELDAVVAPASEILRTSSGWAARWSAMARVGGEMAVLDCTQVGSGDAIEWAAALGIRVIADPARTAVDPTLLRRAREATRTRGLAVRLECDTGADRAAEALLTLLPARLLGAAARAIHLSDRTGGTPPGTLALSLVEDLGATAAALKPFLLDSLTVCVDTLNDADLAELRVLAPFVAVLPRCGVEAVCEFDFVVRLRLGDDGPVWMLVERD